MEHLRGIIFQYSPEKRAHRHMEDPGELSAKDDVSPPSLLAVDKFLLSNPELYKGLEKLALAQLRSEEELKRQAQRAQESQEQLVIELSQKKAHIRQLTQKIQSLNFQPNILCDDDAARTMRRLKQRLNNWTNTCFRDEGKMEKLRQDLEYHGALFIPKSPHEIRAVIASAVSETLFEHIFSSFMFGIPTNGPGPEHVTYHWRTATSIAVEELGDESNDIDTVVSQVEMDVSNYFSVETTSAVERLRQLVRVCMQFKRQIDRQESHYRFSRSALGSAYVPDLMQHAVPGQGYVGPILCAMWPGLYKETKSGPLVVEPETVLAQEDAVHETSTAVKEQETLYTGLKQTLGETAGGGKDKNIS
ncbi:hypothetical protein ASPNIDRAFT_45038 [Aspergillus niger ATCC 1015]|uniref:Uncharacterized protein n=1 Tax=Aspergillus niger (strain ATCC 1015 / CBS 113.46 / FGSC A1144 / LSHB Ac4 / NCTC 3858a / NRRL 328 / USDA 3528.7) TaxID=380704 RepID=G3Y495_ASPNA|nr:hypothetical protein ASPNIDRAFT_45038 [Aspergillus niger ATCC 1015]